MYQKKKVSKMVLLFILFVFFNPALSMEKGNSSMEGNIFYGFDALITEYPYAVYLRHNNATAKCCTATLITSQSVVTAASCLDLRPVGLLVYLGATIPKHAKMTIRVVDVAVHKKFNRDKQTNNVGVAFLEKRVTFGRAIQKLPIPKKDPIWYFADPPVAYSVGWGQQELPPKRIPFSIAHKLKGTHQRIMTMNECKKFIPGMMPDKMFCTYPLTGHLYKDDCGAALVLKKPTLLMVGILSHIVDDVAVFSNAFSHSEWIFKSVIEMGKANCGQFRKNRTCF